MAALMILAMVAVSCAGELASTSACSYSLEVLQGDPELISCEETEIEEKSGNGSQPSRGMMWRCATLQEALNKSVDLGVATSPDDPYCVHVVVPAGHHVITAPVNFGNASVEIRGPVEAVRPPTIYCNYTVNVDNERIFDLNYSYVDFTLNFVGSQYVSFRGVEFAGCPYPLRLEGVRTVAVYNSIFQ